VCGAKLMHDGPVTKKPRNLGSFGKSNDGGTAQYLATTDPDVN
jgi:hypothetical protein